MPASQPAWRNAHGNQEKEFWEEVFVLEKILVRQKIVIIEEVIFGEEILIRKKEFLEKELLEKIIEFAQI